MEVVVIQREMGMTMQGLPCQRRIWIEGVKDCRVALE